MIKELVCPYCNSNLNTIPNGTSMNCPRCGKLIRIKGGKLYKGEEMPPEVSCCFVGIFANIARIHEEGHEEDFQIFLEEFLRNQNLTKKQYEYLTKFYQKESRKGFSFGHESNKSYIFRLKNVIDEICSSMRMSEQELYEDSVLKMIINFMRKGGEITEEEQKIIDLYKNIFGMSDKRYEIIFNSFIEKDKAKKEKIEKVAPKKSIDDVFEDARKEIFEKYSQKDFVNSLILGFKRPFIIKEPNHFLKNIISVFSAEDIFVRELINVIAFHLGSNKLTNGKIETFDFIVYKKEESFGTFVNHFVDVLTAQTSILIFENFELACESCKTFVRNLCKTGRVEVNTPKGVLEIKTKDEYFVFVENKTVNEFENIIGNDIFASIKDIIKIPEFSLEEISQMIVRMLNKFRIRCKEELNVNTDYTYELEEFLKNLYSASSGIKGVSLLIDTRIFEPISEYKLKGKITDKSTVIVTVSDKRLALAIDDEFIILDDVNDARLAGRLASVKEQLASIIGLTEVKDCLLKLEDNIKAQKIRERAGMKIAPLPLNMIFTGNPGTGKTTIARIVAEYLNALGVLEKGNFVEVSRADLVGSHSGETAQMTREKVTQAIGGVLFIDEAYSLLNSKNDDYGQEALDTLVKMIEDNRENLVVILAGYKEDMDELMRREVALKSRFPNIIHFADYTAEEMYRIAVSIAKQNEYEIDSTCYDELITYFESKIYKGKNPNGNGRLVRNLIETAISNQAVRVVKENEVEYSLLKLVDFDLEKKTTFHLEEQLSTIIGLENVKSFLKNQYQVLKAQEKRKSLGIDTDVTQSLNMIFMGNPGTGKTTVARLIANMLKDMGILRNGQLVEVSRSDLVAEYVGQTAPKVTDVFQSALGGVLFIDEAYSLSSGGDNDFGKEAIDTLIKLMEDHRGEIVVILAGYNKEMTDFLKINSGLESRFPLRLDFPDYDIHELMLIFDKMLKDRGFQATEEARNRSKEKIEYMQKTATTDSGNGRMVRNLIDEIIRNQSARIAATENVEVSEINVILPEDVGKTHEMENSKYDYEQVFDEIIGLESVKNYIRTLAARIQIMNERKKLGMVVSEEQSLHMIFKGNPGTGKTMMARAVANMLYQLGIISSNKLVETDRAGLVAGYVGQTALKTTEKVKEAFGGVLFIDEAYSLTQGGNHDFGKEAIDTLIKLMDDNRDKLVVILAGYSKEMTEFMDANSGLVSRFPNVVEFEDYTVDELMMIAKKTYEKNGYILTESALEKLKGMVETAKKDVRFGNGRYIRNVFERSVNNQALRLSNSGMVDRDSLMNILAEDIS